MATIGQAIPNGTFQTFHKEEIRPVSLESYRGRWLVLVFYPGDFTFICPTELQELGELYGEFQKLGAEVIGVSTDSVYVHKAWHDTSPAIKNLMFPLLADAGRIALDQQEAIMSVRPDGSPANARCVRALILSENSSE